MKKRVREIILSIFLVMVCVAVIELLCIALITVRQSRFWGWQMETATIIRHRETLDEKGKPVYEAECRYSTGGKEFCVYLSSLANAFDGKTKVSVLYDPKDPAVVIPAAELKQPVDMMSKIPLEMLFFSVGAAFVFLLKELVTYIMNRICTAGRKVYG